MVQKAKLARVSPIKKPPQDSRGNMRLYTDIPVNVAQEFAVLAIRRGLSKRDLMAELIMNAVAGR